jgi:hypothetical protein
MDTPIYVTSQALLGLHHYSCDTSRCVQNESYLLR